MNNNNIKPDNCDNEQCIKKWNLYTSKTQEEENLDYKKGNLGLQHCDNWDCHNIFWRRIAGEKCTECNSIFCSQCSIKWGDVQTNGTWKCCRCLVEDN